MLRSSLLRRSLLYACDAFEAMTRLTSLFATTMVAKVPACVINIGEVSVYEEVFSFEF